MYGFRSGGGFGAAAPTNAYVQTAPPANPTGYDCNSFFPWLVQPTCSAAPTNWFNNTFGLAPNYTGLPEPPAPAPPVQPVATPSNPSPLVTPPVDQPSGQQTVDATIAATQQTQQQQAQNFFTDLNTSIQNQAACSQALGISSSLGICDSTIYWTGGILAGLLALFAFAGRR